MEPTSKPPLPNGRKSKRSLKQREREEPDVDWDGTLQHFAVAVSDDLDALNANFLQQNTITFSAWKGLWNDARMSAAFHVEFWESSPTNTHKTILQQALDALVCTIHQHSGEFHHETEVASLIGRVFALYCAYMTQLGSPRHKIDVDPQTWTALLTINCVMCGVGKSMFPVATREVRAMMHRLAVEEKAFLRCLQGFGHSVRVRKRPVVRGGENQDFSLVQDTSMERGTRINQSTMERLKSLNGRYHELMARARSAGASVGARRGKPASGSVLPIENDGQDLARGLSSYVEYKANEGIRRSDRVTRAADVRENERRAILEQTSRHSDGRSNILDLSDRSSVISASTNPTINRQQDGCSSDAFLDELESELHADITNDQVVTTAALVRQRKHSCVISEISEADNDGLADLERELEQSVDITAASTQNEGISTLQNRGRHSGVISKRVREPLTTDTTVTTTAQNKPCSWVSEISEADSDALADLERELEQSVDATVASTQKEDISALPLRQNRGPRSGVTAKRVREPLTSDTIARKPLRKAASALKRSNQIGTATAQVRRSKPCSWASEISEADSDALADLERELEQSVHVTAASIQKENISTHARIASNQITTTTAQVPRSKPCSWVSEISEVDSDALADLERELEQTVDAIPAPSLKAGAIKRNKCELDATKCPPTRARLQQRLSSLASDTESNGLEDLMAELESSPIQTRRGKKRIQGEIRPKVPSRVARQTPTQQKRPSSSKRSKSPSRPPAATIGLRRSARLSSLASDNESDGLEDLLAELDSTPVSKPRVKKQRKLRQVQERPKTKSLTQKKRVQKKAFKPSTQKSPSVQVRLPSARPLSTRSSSIAFDSDNDLAELEAELQAGPS